MSGGQHQHIQPDALFAWMNGELDDGAAVEHAVAECAHCRAEAEALSAMLAVGRDLHRGEFELAKRRGRRRLEAALRADAVAGRRSRLRGQGAAVVLVAMFSGAALAMGMSAVMTRTAEPAARAPADASVGDRSTGSAAGTPAPAVSAQPEVGPRAALSSEDGAAAGGEAGLDATALPSTVLSDGAGAEEVARSASPASTGPLPLLDTGLDTVFDTGLDTGLDTGPPTIAPDPRPRVAMVAGALSPQEAAAQATAELADAAPGDPRWFDLAQLEAFAGDSDGARLALVNALPGERGAEAALRLEQMVREGAVDAAALMDGLDPEASAAEGRLGCILGLRYHGDRAAIERCQAYFRTHPGHGDVRLLALAAGRTAEHRLGDYELAISEYSRAILVSQYAGVPGTEALLARARCRSKAGHIEEARADLRLYLDVQPEARWRQDVRDVAENIGISLGDAR